MITRDNAGVKTTLLVFIDVALERCEIYFCSDEMSILFQSILPFCIHQIDKREKETPKKNTALKFFYFFLKKKKNNFRYIHFTIL